MGLRHLSGIELTEHADGETSPAKFSAVQEHLRACPRCAAALAKVQEAASAVQALEAVAAPAELRDTVEARVAAEWARDVSCREAVPLIHEHLDGSLRVGAAVVLQCHLSACERCRSELASLSAARRLVKSMEPVESPPLVREVVAAARRLRPREMVWVARWRPALAAAAVAAAVGALFWLGPNAERPGAPRAVVVAEERETPVGPPAVVAARGDALSEVATLPAGVEEIEVALAAAPVGPAERAEEPRRRRETPPTAVLVRGPAPAPMIATAPEPEVPLPSALRTLRAVATSASEAVGDALYEREVRLALELAGERFATLESESMWARLPSEVSMSGPGHESPAAAPGTEERHEESSDSRPDSTGAPVGDRASAYMAPLV